MTKVCTLSVNEVYLLHICKKTKQRSGCDFIKLMMESKPKSIDFYEAFKLS